MRFADEPPEDLVAWLRAGIRRPVAMTWRRWGFTLEQATAWRQAGVTDGLTAARWRTAGVTSTTVTRWRNAGIDAPEAVQWHEMGFTLDQAKDHKAAGRSPAAAFHHGQRITQITMSGSGTSHQQPHPIGKFLEAGVAGALVHAYLRMDWTDADALAWAKAGIEAYDARLWRTLGLTATEATDLTRAKVEPAQVVREWWQAGIPFDEVGDWLGAGLTSEEAATQRANGVTVEQAAALRALRRDNPGS